MSDDRTIANSSEQNQKVSNNTELWRALENEHYSNNIPIDAQHAAATRDWRLAVSHQPRALAKQRHQEAQKCTKTNSRSGS
jgi:hypothetical protein